MAIRGSTMRAGRAVVLASVGVGAVGATAVGAQARPTVPVLHPHYRLVGHQREDQLVGDVGVASTPDGRYALLSKGQAPTVGTIVDERTGRRRLDVLPRSCRTRLARREGALGDRWLAAQCARGRAALCSLATGRWRFLSTAKLCDPAADVRCLLLAVGSDWIEYNNGRGASDPFVFQNIASGTIRPTPTHANPNPRGWAALDSPQLSHRICSPLRLPRYGTVQLTGPFVIVTTRNDAYLERCGTRLHRLLSRSYPIAVGRDALLFYDDLRPQIGRLHPITGLALPSLKAFKVAPPPLPRAEILVVDLTVGHIYIQTDAGAGGVDVWSAPVPRLARAPSASSVR